MVSSQRQNGGTERGPEYSGNSVDMPLRFYESKLKGSAHLFSFDGVGVQRVRDAPAVSAFVLWSSHGLALGNEWLGLFCVGRDLKSPFSHFLSLAWVHGLLVVQRGASCVLWVSPRLAAALSRP